MTVLASIHGHAMAEPQLAPDVPVAQPAKPVEVGPLVTLRMPAHLARLRCGECFVPHLFHAQPPLLADEGFDDRMAAVAVPDLVDVRLLLDQEPLRLQLLDHALADLEGGQAVVGQVWCMDGAVQVHAVDDGKAVPLADLVVERVVPGRDLQGPGAKLLLHRLVGDDGQLTADDRKHRRLADDVAVALVLGVDRHAGVGEHRLRPHGGDGHVAAALDRVADEVQHVVVLLPLDLEVGDGRPVVRAPVDDARSAVDPTALVEGDERRHHRAVVARVHGEAQPRPVHRRAEQPQLVDDGRADRLIPAVHARVERLAAELLLGRAFPRKLLLDDVLGRDGRVVVAG